MKFYEWNEQTRKFKIFKKSKNIFLESPFYHGKSKLKEGDILEQRQNTYTIDYYVLKLGLYKDRVTKEERYGWFFRIVTIVENDGFYKRKSVKEEEQDARFTKIESLKMRGHEISNGEILKTRTDMTEYYEDKRRQRQLEDYRKHFKNTRV